MWQFQRQLTINEEGKKNLRGQNDNMSVNYLIKKTVSDSWKITLLNRVARSLMWCNRTKFHVVSFKVIELDNNNKSHFHWCDDNFKRIKRLSVFFSGGSSRQVLNQLLELGAVKSFPLTPLFVRDKNDFFLYILKQILALIVQPFKQFFYIIHCTFLYKI